MILRPYQQAADEAIHVAWRTLRRVLYVAPCRSGKTVQMAEAIRKNAGWSVVIAHRAELVAQMSLTLARFGIYHRVVGPVTLARACSKKHREAHLRDFIRPGASVIVASVDTLVNLKNDPMFEAVTLWITDEAHHLLTRNKWGQVVGKFPRARGLGVTATPCRSDGAGLGAHADGVFETLILGPSMRDLTAWGNLAPYKIVAPQSDIDLASVHVTASGEFNQKEVAQAVHKSKRIVGDVVQKYLQFTPDKLGLTFAVDIESATELAAAYNAAGVPAAIVSSKTDDGYRRELQHKHQRGEILQLVNVDLFGEGVDIQMLEVVSFARPTASRGLYVQQFMRCLNPDPKKSHGTIIDHVGNVLRHRLPDANTVWTLDRKEKRGSSTPDDVMPLRSCPRCLGVYEAFRVCCPYCGFKIEPTVRGTPEGVEGDLAEMSEELLARLRGEAGSIDRAPAMPYNAAPVVVASIAKRHRERGESQQALREVMAIYGGWQESLGRSDSEIQRAFFLTFGVDVLSAQGLNRADSDKLKDRVEKSLARESVVGIM
jgi:superfamily II DNA or RNA helicase